MSFPRTNHRNWDEFRWEQEIRRDERRINCFFRLLPSCLDLPGEEEMISNSIASQADLLPDPSIAQGSLPPWSYLAVGEINEPSPLPAEGRRPGEYIIESLDKLASQWNCHCAMRPQIHYAALTICCAYAKLLARCADFFDTPEEDAALRKCLGKRTLNDLQELHKILELLADSAPSEASFAGFQQKRLLGLREAITDIVTACK
jgi:hypothetical protein